MHFDDRETCDPERREEELVQRLPALLRHAGTAAGWAALHADIDRESVMTRAALARLPVLRKADIMRIQAARPPFGGFVPAGPGARRVFMSPGPIWEPQGAGSDPWNSARALFAAGFRAGDIVHNAFAYHLTPGGFILDAGAIALGCCVFPAGTGNTQQQVEAIAALKPAGYVGTPDFLKVLLDKADELNADVSSLTKALVSGGALFPSLRQAYRDCGIAVLQCYATADLGVIAYESAAMEGMIVNEDYIVEIVRPGTGDPVEEGEVGELVVTSFNETYPLIRFATGDLSAVLPGASPCGRTNMRIKGWMGRADQRAKVKGMFIDPVQVAELAKRHRDIGRLRLVVSRQDEQDRLVVKAEAASSDAALADRLAQSVREVLKLKGEVDLVAPASLPNDGKVIADERDYSEGG